MDLKPTHEQFIVGGTTKAATTSIFQYLSDHPEVDASTIKESRFFLEDDYPVQGKFNVVKDGIDAYGRYYSGTGKVRVEATPDYLYSNSAAKQIKTHLQNVQFLFILREPISRLLSWFKYSKQTGRIGRGVSFKKFIKLQNKDGKQHLRALDQGLYSKYLKEYFETFGADRVTVVFYEEFRDNKEKLMQEICHKIDINPLFYDDYKFEIHNKSMNLKTPFFHKIYIGSQRWLFNNTINRRSMRKLFGVLKRFVEPLYLSFNKTDEEAIQIDDETMEYLQGFYKSEFEDLEILLGRKLPWKTTMEI